MIIGWLLSFFFLVLVSSATGSRVDFFHLSVALPEIPVERQHPHHFFIIILHHRCHFTPVLSSASTFRTKKHFMFDLHGVGEEGID